MRPYEDVCTSCRTLVFATVKFHKLALCHEPTFSDA